jgi:ribose transport system substrate-binding protein
MVYKRLLSLAAVTLIVGACSTSAATTAPAPAGTPAPVAATPAPTPAASQQNYYIPIVSKGFQHQFWQAVKKGSEAEAAAEGVTVNFMGPDTETATADQITMLTTELAKKPAAICVAALDPQAELTYLQKYKDANIPVIGFDSGVDPFVPVTTVATDNLKAAAVAADHLGDAIGGTGKIGIIVHSQTAITGTSRRDGFLNEIKAKYPNITVLTPVYADGDQAKSADAAKAMMQANPDLKAIFGTNEGSAIGVVNAVKEANKVGKIVVVGYDSAKGQIDAINSGLELGAITQNPVGIGTQCVVAAVKAIKGISQPTTIDTGFYWYDKTNITDPKIAVDLYQ